jgi:N-carbamoylputrescine amidase
MRRTRPIVEIQRSGSIYSSMSTVTVAATQMACSWDRDANMARAEKLVREAATRGAQVVLLQELFETPYFCKDHTPKHLELALPLDGHPAVEHFRKVARELGVVLPISVFERANNAFYNSVVIVDADGSVVGSYRKSHIPEGPGYHEKFYFSPGDTGFRVFDTRYAKLGVAICWDQWFPEAARSMALMGAEILLYPTAIGSEPQDAGIDSSGHWQRTMQGHAAANVMPVVASNRIGTEKGDKYTMTFYGSSFIASATGEKLTEADRTSESVLTATFDLDEVRRYRQAWGVFRDRRPDLYYPLLSLDGRG